jgi:hypothetical protein
VSENPSERRGQGGQNVSFLLGAVTAMSATLLGALIATRGKLFKSGQKLVEVVEQQVPKRKEKGKQAIKQTGEKIIKEHMSQQVAQAENAVKEVMAKNEPAKRISRAEEIEKLLEENAAQIKEKIVETPSGRKLKIVQLNGEKLKEIYFKNNSTDLIAFEDCFKNGEVVERIYYREGKCAWYKTLFENGEEIKRINFLEDGVSVDFCEIKIDGAWVKEDAKMLTQAGNTAVQPVSEKLDAETIRRELKDYIVDEP